MTQLDLAGNFIKEWESIKEVTEKLNISSNKISTVANNIGSKKTAGGFKWKF